MLLPLPAVPADLGVVLPIACRANVSRGARQGIAIAPCLNELENKRAWAGAEWSSGRVESKMKNHDRHTREPVPRFFRRFGAAGLPPLFSVGILFSLCLDLDCPWPRVGCWPGTPELQYDWQQGPASVAEVRANELRMRRG